MELCSTVYLLSMVIIASSLSTERQKQLTQMFHSLSQGNPLNDKMKFAGVMIYLICVIMQIFLNTFFGSRLSLESDGIAHAIYSSPWMDRNVKCRRAQCILVERSMRPIVIYAGGLFELSLSTFVNVNIVDFSFICMSQCEIMSNGFYRYAEPPTLSSMCFVQWMEN